jgi:hypothetical protein
MNPLTNHVHVLVAGTFDIEFLDTGVQALDFTFG